MYGFISSALRTALLCVALAALSGMPAANAQQWTDVQGGAHDVGVGANGAVWVIGMNQRAGGYDIWRLEGGAWESVPGAGGLRIAVGPDGEAWVVNDQTMIVRIGADGPEFMDFPGKAIDIGVGANGTVWVVGGASADDGYDIYRSTDKGATWTKMAGIEGLATRVSVDAQGKAWVVNNTSNIFRYDGAKFVPMPGSATDIGIGADNMALIVRSDGSIHRFEGSNWVKKTGIAEQVAAGAAGSAWAVNSAGKISYTQLAPPAAPVASSAAPPVQPSSVRWTLSKVTFDDGGSADGWFDLDAATGAIRDYEIVTSTENDKVTYNPSVMVGACPSATGICAFAANGSQEQSLSSYLLLGSSSYVQYEFFGVAGTGRVINSFSIGFVPADGFNSSQGIKLSGKAGECLAGDVSQEGQGFKPFDGCSHPKSPRRVNGGTIEPSRAQ